MPRRKLSSAFSAVLRDHRKARGLSQEALAARAGVHPTYVGLVERGKRNPSLDVAASFAEAVGLTLAEMVREAEHRARRGGG